MKTTVSTKYQVVIPKLVREQLTIKPGQKLTIRMASNGDIVMHQDKPSITAAFLNAYGGSLNDRSSEWSKEKLDATAWLRRGRDNDW